MIILRNMTDEEFKEYLEVSIKEYAEEKVKAGNLKKEGSYEKALEEFNTLLPNGKETKDNYLLSIVEEDKNVGIFWLSKKDEHTGFIYDIKIFDRYQGKGYGRQAMESIEVFAKKIGITEIGLHVFGHNKRAFNLYKSLKYEPINIVMSKKLLD
ncbi:GNAT family N-acetyltransferase [Clostridium ihumii]|uniref:GNAT family N-acetyltransferase n=1 Tax=Clostridium ihumii TaxID=1470356 RepID=UPI003D327390